MYEITVKLLAIFFSFLIFAQAYLFRLTVGTYIHPAALFSLAWFFFTIIPLVVLFNVPVNPLAVLFILMCVWAFSLGSLPFNWAKAYKNNKLKTWNDYSKFNSKFINILLYLSSVSSIIFSTISMISYGYDLNSIIFNLIETSGQFAALRGKGDQESNVWVSVAIFFTYATPILGGFVYQHQNNIIKKITILFVAFFPAIYFMLTQSAKLVVFFAIGFYFASVLLMKIYSNNLFLFEKRYVLKMFGFALLLLPLLSVSILSRDHFGDFDDIGMVMKIIFSTLSDYALGQPYAFSDFFSSYLGMKSEINYLNDYYTYGNYTFASLFELFGSDKVFPPGLYEDAYSYKDEVATNIFTIFRGLIYDFSGVGVLFFMFVIGFFIHAFFYLLLMSRNSWMACSVFIVSIVFFQGTYLFSVFMARYMYLILVSFFAILWINNKLSIKS